VYIEWDKEQEWPRRYLRPLLRRIIADWREERVSIDRIISIFWGTFNVAALSIARYAREVWKPRLHCPTLHLCCLETMPGPQSQPHYDRFSTPQRRPLYV